MSNKLSPGDRVSVDAGLGITKTGNVQRITESTVFVKHYNGAIVGYRTQHVTKMISEEAAVKPRGVGLASEFAAFAQVMEKKLTPAELKKREEVAKAMERENPDMPMDKKMAIATATAKKVAEEAEQIDELSQDTLKSYVKKVADDAMKHPMNPTKRPAEKASKSVTGFSKALNRLPPEKFFNKEETKPHTVPKTAKEKDLAALAEPKDKITHADVMVGRGVKKEEISTAQMGHAGKTTIKHIKNPTVTQRMAAHDVKPGVAGYRDRIALLKAAQAQGNLKEEDVHYCAKHVFSERFGEGMVVEGQHAEPNEQGLIEWYDVDFGGTVRRVMTEKVKVMHAEYHMNHKKKIKEEDEVEVEDEDDKKEMEEMSSKEKMKRGLYNKEEVELEEATENLPGKATHLTNKDIRHAEHGIIPGSTTLRHIDGNKYEVRAGRAKGKTVELDKQHVQKLSMEEVVAEAMISYSDFQSKIDAHRKAGNQIKDDKYDKKKASYTVVDQEGTAKKITHTDAGVSQQHLGSMKRDDSDDKSAETKPKETRGRGRPAGSKSGARN